VKSRFVAFFVGYKIIVNALIWLFVWVGFQSRLERLEAMVTAARAAKESDPDMD
jgi:hypothetical protein